jgi:hypothetical protein
MFKKLFIPFSDKIYRTNSVYKAINLFSTKLAPEEGLL